MAAGLVITGLMVNLFWPSIAHQLKQRFSWAPISLLSLHWG
jgi:hypothetical protein